MYLLPLLLLLIAVEIWVIILVAEQIGVLYTLLLLLASSIAGVSLMRYEGRMALDRAREALRLRQMPGRELADGALILIGGFLLLVPGFITDVAGLALLLPPT